MKSFSHKINSKKVNIIYEDYLKFIKSNFSNIITICDTNVLKLYPQISALSNIIKIIPSEKQKNYFAIENIYSEFLKYNVTRDYHVIIIGGGITCDLGAFASSTFYRGLNYSLVPTTLLAMTDASIGGKNGYNLNNHKNIVGTINQPQNIIIDTDFLKTLPNSELKNGMSEIIKHSIISGNTLYKIIKNTNKNNIYNNIENIIDKSIKLKLKIVSSDEYDAHNRMVLNLGHTLGHIIELNKNLKHGEAVATGIFLSAKLSVSLKKCDKIVLNEIDKLFKNFGINYVHKLGFDTIKNNIIYDKKKKSNKINFVFIYDFGVVKIEEVDVNKLLLNIKKIL